MPIFPKPRTWLLQATTPIPRSPLKKSRLMVSLRTLSLIAQSMTTVYIPVHSAHPLRRLLYPLGPTRFVYGMFNHVQMLQPYLSLLQFATYSVLFQRIAGWG